MRNAFFAALAAAAALSGCASQPAAEAEYHPAPLNDFERAFASKPGVKPIRWGGWIEVSAEGAGEAPTPDDRVRVNYRGTLVDGTEFDSSYKRGEPAVFRLSDVIPCWTNGIMMLKPGAKARLVCPSAAAYGERGSPPTVPPNATLAFDVEMLAVLR